MVPFHAAIRMGHSITAIWMALADTCLNVFLVSREGNLPERVCQQILVQACLGAEHVHSNGIVHRDLKPGNILLHFDPFSGGMLRVWLADFGKACECPPPRHRQEANARALLSGRELSETLRWPWSQTACTVQYAAPEILKGLPAGCSADTWSLGVIGFEMIAGRRLVISDDREKALAELEAQRHGLSVLMELSGRCDATWCKDPKKKKNIPEHHYYSY